MDLRTSSTLSGYQFDGENRDCHLHNLCSSDRLVFADGVLWDLRSQKHSLKFEYRSWPDLYRISLIFLFYSSSSSFNSWNPHILGEKSSDFLCKSVAKSSDDADFIKSMDLSDLSEDLQIFVFWFNLSIFVIWIDGVKSWDLFNGFLCSWIPFQSFIWEVNLIRA